jgi:hypothetical protein
MIYFSLQRAVTALVPKATIDEPTFECGVCLEEIPESRAFQCTRIAAGVVTGGDGDKENVIGKNEVEVCLGQINI